MHLTIDPLRPPATPDEVGDAGDAFREFYAFQRTLATAHYGTPDVAASPGEVLGRCHDSAAHRVVILVARLGGRVVGAAEAWIPQLEDLDLIEGGWALDPSLPDADARVTAAALVDAVMTLGTTEGRPLLTFEAPCEPGTLVPSSGVGGVDPTGVFSEALLARGFTVEQTLRYQVADLAAIPIPDERLSGAAASGYRLHTWTGRIPGHLRTPFGVLKGLMSTEIPSGTIEFQPQVWDEARIVDFEVGQERRGRTTVGAIVLSAAGEPAGYTAIFASTGPTARQGDTLVAPAHRGHGLGRWLKLGNLANLCEAAPGVRYVLTDNADENSFMLAINDEIGFTTMRREGFWQHKAVTPA